MNVILPESHLDLLKEPYKGILTTFMPNGIPQSSIVWCDFDGTDIIVNTTRERQKGKNILLNPKVSLIIVDPKDTGRWISIQGKVEIDTQDVIPHLDKVTKKYTKHDQFYGNIYPFEQQFRETRIKCRIKPIKVIADAIHK